MNIKILLSICFLVLSCTSCLYEMPNEDDLSIIPNTNNPNNIRDSSPILSPGIEY